MLPLSTFHILSLIISLLVAGLGYILSALILKKYLKKRINIVLFLFFSAFFLITATLIDPVILLISRNQLTKMLADEMIEKGSAISFSLTAIANIFLLEFQINIFYKEKRTLFITILILIEGIIAIITPILRFNGVDIFYILIAHMLTSFIIYGNQFRLAHQLRAKIKPNEDLVGKKGLLYLELAGISLGLVLISFLFQEILFMFQDIFIPTGLIDELGCSLFVPIGWTFGLIAMFFMYIGYLMPDWIRKRWEISNTK